MNKLIILHGGLMAVFVLLISSCGVFQRQTFSEQAAAQEVETRIAELRSSYRDQAESQWHQKQVTAAGHTMKFDWREYGEVPADGRSLYISLHGGGGVPAAANDQQWRNQITLYTPEEGLYIAPRAPTDNWNLWHEDHMDDLLIELIKTTIVAKGVNPDRVYLMGYSAGGDGLYQLAPRMAQHWAAAAMMAGHPGDADARTLRNVPFAIYMGGRDAAYQRNDHARDWARRLDSLRQQDPGGYEHQVHIFEDMPHWMGRKDTIALDWMVQFQRQPLPDKVVWVQDDRHHTAFYWLGLPPASAQTGATVIASITGNTITLEQNDAPELIIYLNDELVNLNKPVTVIDPAGNVTFRGRVKRDPVVIQETAERFLDAGLTFTARLQIQK